MYQGCCFTASRLMRSVGSTFSMPRTRLRLSCGIFSHSSSSDRPLVRRYSANSQLSSSTGQSQGVLPASKTNSTIAQLHTSEASGEYECLSSSFFLFKFACPHFKISGAIYGGLPQTIPQVFLSPVLGLKNCVASPKSANFKSPRSLSSIFSGLISLCAIPLP